MEFLYRQIVTGQGAMVLSSKRLGIDWILGGEALEEAAQRNRECPIPECVQDQDGQGSEKPGLVVAQTGRLELYDLSCPLQPKPFNDSTMFSNIFISVARI